MKRTMNATLIRTVLSAAALTALLRGTPAAAQAVQTPDSVTVANVTAGGGVVDVPVYIRDVSGTPLGRDQPPGSKIQSYSIKVNYAPTAAVQSISFTRAGITTPLTPTFEANPSSPGSVSLIDTFQESTNLIPFTLNAAAPGDQVGHLLVNLSPLATPGTVIALTLDPTLTQLTDEGGDGATKESVGTANLLLVNGSITVTASTAVGAPTLGETALLLLVLGLAVVAVRFRL
jgi:hypothetical protein